MLGRKGKAPHLGTASRGSTRPHRAKRTHAQTERGEAVTSSAPRLPDEKNALLFLAFLFPLAVCTKAKGSLQLPARVADVHCHFAPLLEEQVAYRA